MVGAYAPCAKFIKLGSETGLKALYLNVSFVGSAPLARELGRNPSQVIVTQVVPHPHEKDLPIVRNYHKDLGKMDPSATPTFGSLEGYIAARILVKGLGHVKGHPTRESIIDALEGLGTFDIGLGKPLQLTPKEHQASHRIWPTILRKGEFVPFEWKEIVNIMKAGT
jgi:ABC-type branched-subunit amino acid transport system substrate-binding protein